MEGNATASGIESAAGVGTGEKIGDKGEGKK
jgi:hypothetical protein